MGPPPQLHPAEPRAVGAWEDAVTGFVFKVQANMDPKHRDRVAFVRLCSGHFQRGMKLFQVRAGKPMAVSNPVLFLAQDRALAEDAWAGDIIGIPNHGQLRIGDALTEGEALRFTGIPSFAPELLQAVRAGDPMKAKHLEKALSQFAEEGASKLFKPNVGSGWIVGVVGPLQFDVLASRIEQEYGLPVRFEPTQFTSARWVSGPRDRLDAFARANKGHMAADHDGDPVYMTRLQWDIDRVARDWPELTLAAQFLQSPVDGSGIVSPSATVIFGDRLSVLAALYVPWGAPPVGGVLSTEYGAAALSGLIQLRIYD